MSCSQTNIQIKQSSVKPLASVPPQRLSPARGTGFYCGQLSFADSASRIFLLQWNRSCSGTRGAVPRGASFPLPLPEPPLGSQAQLCPGKGDDSACHTTGRDWDDSDLPCDLERSERMQTVLVPAEPGGCGSAPHPRPLGRKGLIFHTYQDLRDSRGLTILFLL